MSDKRRPVKERLRSAGDDGGWPDEPEEFDPTSLGPDPVSPSPPETDAEGGDLADAFWNAVVLANVGVLAVSVAPMFVYFQGRLALGGGLFAVGAVALYRTYRVYDRATSDDGSEDPEEDDGGVEA
ncbi:DUF7322 domain-containing protein [Halosegnis marinus]|uniref:DUF7322 domain-containing protein n=1 Tax=Halosegnis marinus TaxID=3034023 RepID=A0ABD5ZQZ3_9EURY|nr:hypothetical protein [Halosegnis sp. DT85]